jgi:uncharacterized membrane protein YhdT
MEYVYYFLGSLVGKLLDPLLSGTAIACGFLSKGSTAIIISIITSLMWGVISAVLGQQLGDSNIAFINFAALAASLLLTGITYKIVKFIKKNNQ